MITHRRTTKAAWTIPEWRTDTGIGRSTIYKLIAAGKIEIRKCGKRTLVVTPPDSFISSLPVGVAR